MVVGKERIFSYSFHSTILKNFPVGEVKTSLLSLSLREVFKISFNPSREEVRSNLGLLEKIGGEPDLGDFFDLFEAQRGFLEIENETKERGMEKKREEDDLLEEYDRSEEEKKEEMSLVAKSY